MVLKPIVTEEIYGATASHALQSLGEQTRARITDFVGSFYGSLMQFSDTQRILDRLTPESFKALQEKQAQHLTRLVDPNLEASEHRADAERLGRVHCLVGVDMLWLVESYGLYQQALHHLLQEGDAEHRPKTQRILDRRLLLDLEAQSAGYRQIDAELSMALANIQQQGNLPRSAIDLYRGAIKALCSIDGVVAAFIGRVGLQGVLEIEAFDGPQAKPYLSAMQEGVIPPIRIIERAETATEGPSAHAWLSGQIRTSESYARDPTLEPWKLVGNSLGFRSSAAIPLVDETGQTFALVNMYSRWPGFFSASGRHAFLEYAQQSLSLFAQRHAHGQVIPYQQRRLYSDLVKAEKVQMHYQPIIDLKTGRLIKVEALARLVDDMGQIISPGVFLPALGASGLLRLFEIGVERVCAAHRSWEQAGLDIRVSLNLPPQGVGDVRYHDALFATIERCGTDPAFIEIEILESAESQDTALRDRFFQNLQLCGIKVVQDDLGSGHSSLLRMDSMPFDGVKIDQGLVLRASQKAPQRALEFIYHLTHLAHALKIPVTVEGLEHRGLIEASAILGADLGQGYGIARPMPAEQLVDWHQAFKYDVNPQMPRTPLGAMAGYLLWDRQLGALNHWPDLIEDFIRAPCMVQKFIDVAGGDERALQQLLDKNHALAIQGNSGKLYQRTRQELIMQLSAMSRLSAQASK
jgi:EAL domain-containing protein (putative c-di-GMP-specific phosphodiesterase class I)